MNLLCAAGIGAVSGLRSMTGPALASEVSGRKGVRASSTALKVLAVGELIADKLPFTPNRTEPASLAFRAVSGAFCGYTVCKKRRWIGALVGASAALAASYAGLEYRKRVRLPPVIAALLEDAVAIGTGRAVISAIGR